MVFFRLGEDTTKYIYNLYVHRNCLHLRITNEWSLQKKVTDTLFVSLSETFD